MSATRNVVIALALMVPGSAFASSDEAWSKFAKDVEQKCTEAASGIFRRPQIVVDPTGTENYGVAIIYGRSLQAKARSTVLCVMDKKTGKVELGSELGKDVVLVRKPKGEDNKAGQKKQNNAEGQTNKQNKTSNGNTGSQDDAGDDDTQQ